MARATRRIIIRGQVQGVGFRYTTATLAQDFALDGFVRNLPDGSVEVLTVGEPSEIDALIAAVSQAFAPNIHEIEQEPSDAPTHDLAGFTIRYDR